MIWFKEVRLMVNKKCWMYTRFAHCSKGYCCQSWARL